MNFWLLSIWLLSIWLLSANLVWESKIRKLIRCIWAFNENFPLEWDTTKQTLQNLKNFEMTYYLCYKLKNWYQIWQHISSCRCCILIAAVKEKGKFSNYTKWMTHTSGLAVMFCRDLNREIKILFNIYVVCCKLRDIWLGFELVQLYGTMPHTR